MYKMVLYHYRSIENAIKEIRDCTFHFATRAELNDPLEGYVRVYWQGDKAAWEGLLRNFVCSLYQGIELYLLAADENMIRHNSLIIDLHQFDDVPLGEIIKELGDKFLEDESVQKFAAFYGRHKVKVFEEEFSFILRFVFYKALIICIQNNRERGIIPEEEADNLINIFSSFNKNPFPIDDIRDDLVNTVDREIALKVAKDTLDDLTEFQLIRLGLRDEMFLYGRHRDEKRHSVMEGKNQEAIRRRDWIEITVDFPKIYVDQLKEMMYPESYVVCFSGKNNNSAMWGNYADNHQGVCLIYETDSRNRIMMQGKKYSSLEMKPVSYCGEVIERNFFESFGRLNGKQIVTWLTGTEGRSSSFEVLNDINEWRRRYWSIYETKTYRKLKDWEYENEYRLAINNIFYDFDKAESRNLKYNPKILKGIIFGINTSEYDKLRIMEQLCVHADEYEDFTFYQAEYDHGRQEIHIRKKKIWNIFS